MQISNNLVQRVISGFIFGLIFILSIYSSYQFFFISLILFAAISSIFEWNNMVNSKRGEFSAKKIYFYKILGYLIIIPGFASLIALKQITINSPTILFIYFTAIWSVDVFAFFGGKLIGGPKAFPNISPNKTISGLLVGVTFAGINCYLATFLSENLNCLSCKISAFVFGILMGFVSQFSDVFISSFKRIFKIKDFGSIMPGHGGMLDRFDSIILSAPLFLLLLWLSPV